MTCIQGKAKALEMSFKLIIGLNLIKSYIHLNNGRTIQVNNDIKSLFKNIISLRIGLNSTKYFIIKLTVVEPYHG